MSSEERVAIEVADHIAEVRLNRPDKHNALDQAMFEALRAALEQVEADRSVRAVVLAGEGSSFCSGLDLAAAASGSFDPSVLIERPNDEVANLAQTVCFGWQQLPVPVVCAVHGACFGGGLQIALGADIRFAAPAAKLSIMEVSLGLIPDMGITQALPKLVRADVAKELTFTGRVFGGVEAAEMGIVTRTSDSPLEDSRELAATIAGRSPEAVRSIKRLFNEGWGQPPEVSLKLETALVAPLFGTPNQLEAVRANVARDEPDFADPA